MPCGLWTNNNNLGICDFNMLIHADIYWQVLPSLLQVLDDNANPRVQAHAGAALVNFCEECPKQVLAPYLDSIIMKLAEVSGDFIRGRRDGAVARF